MIDRAARALALVLGTAPVWLLAAPAAGQVPEDAEFVGPPAPASDGVAWPEHRGEMPDIDFSQPVGELEEAIRRAYWHNPRLLAERARKRSVDQRLPQARALYGPQIDYQVDYGYRRDRTELTPDRFRTASGWTGTVSAIVDQPLLTFGRLAANEDRALAEIGFQRASLTYSEQQTIFAAIEAYVAVLRDRNAVAIAQDNLDLVARQLSDSQIRRAARESTVVDTDQLESRSGLAEAELAIALGNLAASEGRFIAEIGSPPADELAPPNPLLLPVRTLPDAIEVALQENPLISAAQYRELISRAALNAAISERLPRVDLRGRADLAPVSAYDDSLRRTSYLGQVILSGPLFTSGLLTARQAEAEAANDADWRLVDASRRDLLAEVTAAWSAWQSTGEALDSFAAGVEAARSAYDGALEQQRAGLRTTLDLLILARELLNVRTSLNAAEADNYVSQARILFSLGMLDMGNLLPASPYYDADRHLEKVDGNGSVIPITPILRAVDGLYTLEDDPKPTRDPTFSGADLGVALSEIEATVPVEPAPSSTEPAATE